MGQSLGNPGAPQGSPSVAQPTKGIVFVHGAGIWQPDYWQPVLDQTEKLVGSAAVNQRFGAIGVHYSDVMNTLAAKSLQLAAQAQQFHDSFMNELLRDQLMAAVAELSSTQLLQKILTAFLPGGANLVSALSAAQAIAGGGKTPESLLDTLSSALLGKPINQARDSIANSVLPGGANVRATIQDVYLYLYNATFAKQIKQRLIDGLHQAQQFEDVVLITHSLGTVVAFDVLNEWTESTPKISYWFTLGCPLTKVLRLRPGTSNRLTHGNVMHWYNVYDTTDIIGGAMGPTFTKTGYSIYDIFVDIAKDPIASHDYFDNLTTLGIIADVLRVEA